MHGPPKVRLKFEVARQASSPSLCASVRAVPWQMRLSNSFPSSLFLGESYLQTFACSEQECWMCPARTTKDTFEIWGGKTSKQPQSLCLCVSSAMGRWGWATAFQASYFWLRAIRRRSHFQSRAAGDARYGPPKIHLKFEVARQASSPSLCASVRAVPWEDEAEQQLSRLALSGCELSADVRIFGAGLLNVNGTDP